MNIAIIVIICLVILALVAGVYYFKSVKSVPEETPGDGRPSATPGATPGGDSPGVSTGNISTDQQAALEAAKAEAATLIAEARKAAQEEAESTAKKAALAVLEAQKAVEAARTAEEKALAESAAYAAEAANAKALAEKAAAELSAEKAAADLRAAQAAATEASRIAVAEAKAKADAEAKAAALAVQAAAEDSQKAANEAAQKKAAEEAAKAVEAAAKTEEDRKAAAALAAKAAAEAKAAADALTAKQAQEAAAKAAAEEKAKVALEQAEREKAAADAAMKAAEVKAAADAAAAEKAKADADATKAEAERKEAEAKAAAEKAAADATNKEAAAAAEKAAREAAEAKAIADAAKAKAKADATEKAEADRKAEELRLTAERAKADAEEAKFKATGLEARKIFYQGPREGITNGVLADVSTSTTYPISLGIGSLYQPNGVTLDEIETKLRVPTSGEATVTLKTVTVEGTIGNPFSIPAFTYPIDGNFAPLGTDILVFLRPKNLLFDKILGGLVFQKISVYNSEGRDVSNAFTPLTQANDFLPFEDVAQYLPAFCKSRDGKALNDIFKDSEDPGVVSSLTANESGIQSFMSLSSTEELSDCYAMRSSGAVISTVILEYNLNHVFSQLNETDFSNGIGLFRHNVRSWLNFCMANTVVCSLNLGANGDARLLSYRTLGPMSLKTSINGISSAAFLPLVERPMKGITFSSFDFPGSKPSSLDTFLAPHLSKSGTFHLSPIDESVTSVSVAEELTVTEVTNPKYDEQIGQASRYYKWTPQENLQYVSSLKSTAASLHSNFVSLPPNLSLVSAGRVARSTFITGRVKVTPDTGRHAVVVQSTPHFYKLIKRSFKMENSPPFPPKPLSLIQGGFTTTTSNPDYGSADRYHNVEEAFYEISPVNVGVEYIILPRTSIPAPPPGYPPEPLTVVIYGKSMEEIATFSAARFGEIRVYVVQK